MKNSVRNRFIWIGVGYAITLGLLLISCEKHVTPNKVDRKITEDSWRITSFIFIDTNVTLDYADNGFSFADGGGIAISNAPTAGGTWSVGLNKKPTILYLTSFSEYPFTRMNDDWEVEACSSDRIALYSKNGSTESRLVFNKKK